MIKILSQLLTGNDLTSPEAEKWAAYIFSAKGSEQFIKSSILLLRKKGEGIEELINLVRYLRKQASSVNVDLPYLVDFCGTGGDRKNTFNISTLAAIVAAGAGAYVAKHGNRSVSSKCGSSDLIENLGVQLKIDPVKAARILKQAHFVYLHAPYFHPAFAKVQKIRQELKTKTIFNFLGPLLNPANAHHQLMGVSEPSLLEVYPVILRELGVEHAWVVMDEGGYDEISLTGNAYAVQIQKGQIRKLKLKPSDFGLNKINPKELVTRELKDNLKIAHGILKGKDKGPRQNVVLANAALGLLASGRANDLREGMALARFSIETGRANHVLEKVTQLSQ